MSFMYCVESHHSCLNEQDEDTRYLDTQRGLPRQRLEAMEHVSIQQNGGVQGYGAQPMFSDAARLLVYTSLFHSVDNVFQTNNTKHKLV